MELERETQKLVENRSKRSTITVKDGPLTQMLEGKIIYKKEKETQDKIVLQTNR